MQGIDLVSWSREIQVLWWIGEDVGFLRSMEDPTIRNQPDRMSDYVNTPLDNYGVHTNSGIGNKLAFLLCEGGSFNGYSIDKLDGKYETKGLRARKLFYMCQLKLLQSSNYLDLYTTLKQAAIDLNFTSYVKDNIEKACLAVEIKTGVTPLELDWVQINETEKTGFVGSHSSKVVNVNFNAQTIESGTYNGNITINCNNANNTVISIPVKLDVQ